ncbi:hypothetical protein [Streptomyces collinus]|uniref:hypothetical protein n=1 Tax=Streptomyces collinus TaxID=42684 RepID=UPI00362BDD0E
MSPEEFAASTIERAWEPPEEVVVPFSLAHDPALQPEDYGVLIRLLLRDPGKPAGVAALAKEFQESGWKMGDSRLRGVMARLKKAGHVNHRPAGYDPVAGRPTWAFAVYRNPANNPQYVQAGAEAASQVRPTRGNPTRQGRGPRSGTLNSNVFAGQTDTLGSNVSDSGTLDFNASESNVFAGQTDTLKSNGLVSSPPHPPEEVTTSSPCPLTDSARSLPSQREEEAAGFAPKDLHAAESFLQDLHPPHHMGAASARKYAPLLLRSMAGQGWPSIHEVDRGLLAREVTRDPAGFKRPSSLVPTRIRDLARYSVVAGVGRTQGGLSGPERCPDHPARYRKGCMDCAMTVPV